MSKRIQYDAEFKRNAILHAEEFGNRATQRDLNICESIVRRWRKDRDFIFSMTSNVKGARKPKARRFPISEKVTLSQSFSEDESNPVIRETIYLKSQDVRQDDDDNISFQDIITQVDDYDDEYGEEDNTSSEPRNSLAVHRKYVNLEEQIQRNKANAKPISRTKKSSTKFVKKPPQKTSEINLVKWTNSETKRCPEIDRKIIHFMMSKSQKGFQLNEEIVRNKAIEIANLLEIDFECNHNWYENIKYHFDLFLPHIIPPQTTTKTIPTKSTKSNEDSFDDAQFLIEYDGDNNVDETKVEQEKSKKKIVRTPYEAKFKRKVILFAEENGNRTAQRHYKINESVIRGWRKERDYIFSCKPTAKRAGGFREGRFPEIEKAVIKSMREKFRKGEEVTENFIRIRAREIADSMGIDQNLFKCSHGWYKKVMRRNKMTSKAVKIENINEDSLIVKDEFNSSMFTEVDLHSNDEYNLKIEILNENSL